MKIVVASIEVTIVVLNVLGKQILVLAELTLPDLDSVLLTLMLSAGSEHCGEIFHSLSGYIRLLHFLINKLAQIFPLPRVSQIHLLGR